MTEYTPSDDDLIRAWKAYRDAADAANAWVREDDAEPAKDEARRALARDRRDAARKALDGLIKDTEIDVRLGIEGGDNLRVQDAEAVIDAATIYRDTVHPEETP